MLYLFARSMTKGGRGLEGHQGVRRQRSNPDRPLPPDMLQLPAARQRVSRSAHEMFSCMMHFDSRVFRRGVKKRRYALGDEHAMHQLRESAREEDRAHFCWTRTVVGLA